MRNIKNFADFINEARTAKVKGQYLGPKEIQKYLKRNKDVYGTDYAGHRVKVLDVFQIKNVDSLDQARSYDKSGWVYADEDTFNSWLDEHGLEVGDWLVAGEILELNQEAVWPLTGWNMQDGGLTVTNLDMLGIKESAGPTVNLAQTKKIAKEMAKALAMNTGVEARVNSRIEVGSFDIDLMQDDGYWGDSYGGSYYINADGEIINAAMNHMVYGTADMKAKEISAFMRKLGL